MVHTETSNSQGEAENGAEASSGKDIAERLNRLEAIVKEQQKIIESQQDKLADTSGSESSGNSPSPATRRGVLTAGSLLALFGIGTGTTMAQQGAAGGAVYNWKQDVDAGGHGLSVLGSLTMADNPTPVMNLAGDNLDIDENGVLNAKDTRTDVSDGTTTVDEATNIHFGTNLSVTNDGDRSATVDATGVDADTLDGVHKSDLDFQYVDSAGDTMSGGLTINGPLDIADGIEVEDVESPEDEDLRVASGADLVLSISEGQGSVRIETGGGHAIVLNDEDGAESISVQDSVGNGVEIDSTTGEVSVSANQKISLDAPEIDISADANVSIESEGTIDIESTAVMDLLGALVRLNGAGGTPAASVGDTVSNGVIQTGSSTVLIG